MSEDFSSIFEKLNIDPKSISPEMINTLMDMLNSNNSETSNTVNNATNNNSFDASNIDIETILKIKSVMEKMNSNNTNPRNNLLFALKPYLSSAKQDKLNQYVKMSKLLDILPYLGGLTKNE